IGRPFSAAPLVHGCRVSLRRARGIPLRFCDIPSDVGMWTSTAFKGALIGPPVFPVRASVVQVSEIGF
ncbi:MAG: hypothetical protein WBE71_03020, partial [Xanthobacteraceae bacterium]